MSPLRIDDESLAGTLATDEIGVLREVRIEDLSKEHNEEMLSYFFDEQHAPAPAGRRLFQGTRAITIPMPQVSVIPQRRGRLP